MSDSQIRTIETFSNMIAQPALTAALNTALRLGVVAALEHGQKTAEEISELCEIRPQGTLALMNLLITAGMVEQFEEHYALSQAARLTSGNLWVALFDQWTGLEQALKVPGENDIEPEYEQKIEAQKRAEQFQAIQSQIQWATTGVALKITEALGIGTERKGLNVLDIGCRSAIYSLAIAHRDPESRIHLVDDAAGLAQAQSTIESLEFSDRVQSTESSELVFAGHNDTFDLVIIGDHFQFWAPEMRLRILATALRTLKPGGEVAIIDVLSEQERGKLGCHLFELQLLIATGNSTIDLKALNDLLEKTGFSRIQHSSLPVSPYTHSLVLAEKP